MKQNQLLIIGYVWPEPTSSAAGTRMMNLIHFFLELGYKITYATPAVQSNCKVELDKLGIREAEIKVNCDSFDEFVKQENPSVVLYDRFMMEEQFGWRVNKYCPEALKILDTEDLHCLRKARHQVWKEKRSFESKDLFSDVAKREVASIYRCDLSLIISSHEMDILTNTFQVPSALLLLLPFMITPKTDEEKLALPTFKERNHFITIGNFLHEPNWNAVLYLKQEIWPMIRAKLPNAELHVYGAYPSQKVWDLNHPKSGFMVKGRAENAHEVVSKAKVCLAPLRFGAGIKGKLAEAMLLGTPSVTTSIGAEGMQVNSLWNGFVEDDPKKFAERAITLYQEESIWEQAQLNGDILLVEKFDKTTHKLTLKNKLQSLINQLPQHRLANFTGSMLQHHSLKTTEYMSKWITEKNK